MNTKREYIHSLSIAKDAFDSVNESPVNGYFTFHTSDGFVVGKFVDVKPLSFDRESDFADRFVEEFRAGKDINLYDVTAGLYKYHVDQLQDEIGTKLIPDSKAIVLEDVKIYQKITDNPIITNTYVLFSDQIVGIIPGKLN